MEELWSRLDKLAESTGVAVEQLYSVLLQQAKVQLVYDILLLIGIIVLVAIGVLITKKCYKNSIKNPYSEWIVVFIILSVVTCAFGFVGVIAIIPKLIKEIVQITVNPPVWVLEYIANLIK